MELIMKSSLKGKTSDERFSDAKEPAQLPGFSTWSLVTVTPDEVLPPVPVTLGVRGTVQRRCSQARTPCWWKRRWQTA